MPVMAKGAKQKHNSRKKRADRFLKFEKVRVVYRQKQKCEEGKKKKALSTEEMRRLWNNDKKRTKI